ncbi:DUF1269 domain-containing protein [Yinghuangia seranimata]|uniref:DUF1269 domain-containing protein n=1 Tax=Yinghuangia seranimata TaxID=408067 RepID=UPI00248D05B9|nr:DUF1269 domain-containing protein [Yinghuangia seranimata]MDI2127678.1 DUF1269 domain-containing protein [Yinghuangia seranimata]
MTTLTVWKFATPEGAMQAEKTLLALQKQDLIKVVDAAVVSWPSDKKKPTTKELNNLTGMGALSGTFWGMLFGLIFFIPLIGAAIGAATGALAGSLTDVGIDDEFINDVRSEVTPGTSALFLMSSDAVMDRVHEAFAGSHAQLIRTNLSNEEETKLREVFAD